MRLFLYLLASAVVTAAICRGLLFVAPGFGHDAIVGNAVFIATLALIVMFSRGELARSPKGLVLAPPLFMVTVMAVAIGAALLLSPWPDFAVIFATPMGVVGYYPEGPDSWGTYGVGVWLLSTLAVIVAGTALGSFLKGLRSPAQREADPIP
jgi:hypothetical protein